MGIYGNGCMWIAFLLGSFWFEGREGRAEEGREEFNITSFGLIKRREGNGREREGLMIICLVKERRG